MEEDKEILISVFSSNNPPLFQIAKSLLDRHGIKFWSNDEYKNLNLIGLLKYPSEIKVFEKDEIAARKILSELTQTSNQYIPSNKSGNKLQSFIVRRGVLIIILFVLIMVTIFLLLKYKS